MLTVPSGSTLINPATIQNILDQGEPGRLAAKDAGLWTGGVVREEPP